MENLIPVLEAKNYTFKASVNHSVLPGDIAFFDFGERKGPQACGIVYRVDNTFSYTLEFEDGKVASATRYLDDVLVFARIPAAGK
jgi:hypothetical protein